MNYKVKTLFKIILSSILTILICVGLMYISVNVTKTKVLKYISNISFVSLLFLMLVNGLILLHKNIRKYKVDPEKEFSKKIKYQQSSKNYNKVYTRLSRKLIFSKIYLITILLFSILTVVCSLGDGTIGIIKSCIAVLIFGDILFSLVSSINLQKLYKKETIVSNHPYLDSIVEKCKKAMNIKDEVCLVVSDQNQTNVTRVNKKYLLTISLNDLMLINEEEFETIVIRELGHIYNGDINVAYKFKKSFAIFENFDISYISLYGKSLLFSLLLNNINKEFILFEKITSFEKELLADEWVLKKDKQQVYINGLTKTYLKYFFQNDRFYYNVYQYEEPLTNYYEWYFSKIYNEYDSNQLMYAKMLFESSSGQLSSIPSLHKRMEKLGVKYFDIDFTYNGSEQYYDEVRKTIKYFDEKWYEENKNDWNKKREQNYLFYLNIYNSIKDKDYDKLKLKEQLSFAEAQFMLGDFENAKICFDKILDKYPNHIYCLKQNGKIKFMDNDDNCIDDLLKVKQLNHLEKDEVNKLIEAFYLYNGFSEELNEHYLDVLNEEKKQLEIDKYVTKKGNNIYQESDLPIEIKKEFKLKVNSYNTINNAYIFKKYTSDTTYLYELRIYLNEDISESELLKMKFDLSMFLLSYDDYVIDLKISSNDKKLNKYIEKNNIKSLINK